MPDPRTLSQVVGLLKRSGLSIPSGSLKPPMRPTLLTPKQSLRAFCPGPVTFWTSSVLHCGTCTINPLFCCLSRRIKKKKKKKVNSGGWEMGEGAGGHGGREVGADERGLPERRHRGPGVPATAGGAPSWLVLYRCVGVSRQPAIPSRPPGDHSAEPGPLQGRRWEPPAHPPQASPGSLID